MKLDTLDWPDPERFADLRREARASSAHLRLCLQQRTWRGAIGNWSGAGTGSSIDFQDHRPYIPGDDPRHIDWAAYARSGNYIMKLYREEVSPRVDLLLDFSRSMTWHPLKRDRMLTLACFCVESAAALGASLRMTGLAGGEVFPFPPETLARGVWPAPAITPKPGPPALDALPLQPGSLRLLISDLLFDVTPAEFLRPLFATKGRAAVFAPYVLEEESPGWNGNLELIDCETGQSRRQRVDAGLRERYRGAYQRHFEQWDEACRRYNARIARVLCDVSPSESLRAEALPRGLVEPWA